MIVLTMITQLTPFEMAKMVMTEMAVYAHTRPTTNWRFDNSGKIMTRLNIELILSDSKLSKTLMISKKGRFEICQ